MYNLMVFDTRPKSSVRYFLNGVVFCMREERNVEVLRLTFFWVKREGRGS